MNTSTATRPQANKKDQTRSLGIADFWEFCAHQGSLNESERLLQIKQGVSAHLVQAIRMSFDLHEHSVATLLNASISTLERRMREQKPLDSVASKRLDRIAAVSHQAEGVFESREAAAQWMSKPNKVLGGNTPIMLCETEIGARQVRRVLQALEWGGAA
ncbi:MAG TPA: antitoxin Xre/MbcA/ParS toxin-binding domain-containing protein [Pseudomonas sp.]|nr:antitoxin Xre/MbcA/ParS toxin-binding domain-containing protein [Pseudomonas sp.]